MTKNAEHTLTTVMKWPLRIFCIVTVSLITNHPCTIYGALPEERFLSLQDCIEIALRNSSSVRKAENTLKLQGSDLLRSYGRFLPTLSVSAGYTPVSLSRSYADPSIRSIDRIETERVDISLTSSLNLFNGFQDYASLQASIKRLEAAGLSLSRAREIIVYDITQAYYQVLLNRELLTIARENFSSSQDQLQLTRRQYEIGIKPVTDFYQQQAETANNELTVIKAENNLRQSRLEMLRRLRINPAEEISVADIPADSLLNLSKDLDADKLVSQGLAGRKDLQSVKLSASAAKWDITRAAAQHFPKLDLTFTLNSGGYPYYATTADVPPSSYTYPDLSDQLSDLVGYSLSISLNWTIFDGFITRYNVQQARINYLNQELDAADLEHDIAIDIQLAADNYDAAFTQIETAKQGLKAAEKAYETVKKQYDLGAASFVEANAAKAALVGARSEYSQAVYNLALQKNILDFATGMTSPQ